MTYTLTLTPYLAAMLDAACRATGLDTLNIFRAHLSPATRQPAEESPAVLSALGLPATPAPVAAAIPPAPEPDVIEFDPANVLLR